MNIHWEIVLRSVIAILMLLLIARILGKQTLSNMTYHDFVTSITLGAVAANLAFNDKLKWSHIIVSLIVIAITAYLLSLLALKNRKLRTLISGAPTTLIEGGKILEGNMKKLRFTLDSLDQALREKDIFNLEEVEYALLEDNGKLSVLRKPEYQNVTKKDMKLQLTGQNFPVELIMDGKIIENDLKNNGLSKEWLESELSKRGKQVSDVFYAVRGTKQQLMFDFYEDNIKKPIDKE